MAYVSINHKNWSLQNCRNFYFCGVKILDKNTWNFFAWDRRPLSHEVVWLDGRRLYSQAMLCFVNHLWFKMFTKVVVRMNSLVRGYHGSLKFVMSIPSSVSQTMRWTKMPLQLWEKHTAKPQGDQQDCLQQLNHTTIRMKYRLICKLLAMFPNLWLCG